MALSMYQASVPVFARGLRALSDVIAHGAAFAEEKGIDPAELATAKLADDMYALNRQVQLASDAAKGTVARLAGLESPRFPDDETTLPELQARIAKTLTFIESVPADTIEGSEERAITLKSPSRDLHFQGQAYLLHFGIPNFYFHVTTAYDILRHKGVNLGKLLFLGGL